MCCDAMWRDVVCTGLEPTGNVVGAPARFTVETAAAGTGELEVVVVSPKGTPEKVPASLPLTLRQTVR